MNAIEHAVALPPDEVVVHRATRRKILRNIAPLTTGAQDVHQAVHHRTHVGAALAAARPRRRNERRDNRPLLVREVARVPQMITIVSRSVFLRPHRQPHESDCLLSITNDSSDSRSFKTDTYCVLEVSISPTIIGAASPIHSYGAQDLRAGPWRLGPSRAAAQWAQRRQINRRLPSLAGGKGQRGGSF
jgi:hypothetical protein